MKRLILLVFCCITINYATAQNVDTYQSWSALSQFANEEVLSYDIDFSNATINAQEVEIFIAHESRWEEGLKDISYRFMTAFNQQAFQGNTPHRISPMQKYPYTLHVKVLQVTTCLFSKHKTHIKAIVSITDQNGITLFSKQVEERNGIFGTHLRLIGDALQAVGETVGRAFYRYAVPQKSTF